MDLSMVWPLEVNVLRLEDLKELALANASEPYWFGLGFIQLKLSDTYRMHFWLPEIPRLEREEIHNHRYDFTSHVLSGKLCHDVYHVTKREGFPLSYPEIPAWHYEIFETDCAPANGDKSSRGKVTPCNVLTMGQYRLSAGTKYTFPFCSFHTTERTKYAITFLRRWPKMMEYASVVKEKGAVTTCPFKDKISSAQCWEYIGMALKRVEQEDLSHGYIRGLLHG